MQILTTLLSKLFKAMRSPYAILIGIASGIAIGLLSKSVSLAIDPFGKVYLTFLQMCIIPIIITAAITGITKAFCTKGAFSYVKKLILFIVIGSLAASGLGITYATLTQPGLHLSTSSQMELGRIISKSELKDTSGLAPEKVIYAKGTTIKKPANATEFIFGMVPNNIFSALNKDENLKVLFFAIILGLALGYMKDKNSTLLMNSIEGLFHAFEVIIETALYGLPITLCCIFAYQTSTSGFYLFAILFKYIWLRYIASFGIMLIASLFLWRMVKGRYGSLLSKFKAPAFITLGSGNSYIAMPSAMKALKSYSSLNKNATNVVLPLGISLFSFGSAFFIAYNCVFFAQLYQIPMTMHALLIILFGSIFVGVATIGAPGFIEVALFSLIFTPLGMPLAPAMAVLIAIETISEPVEELTSLAVNCMMTAFITKTPQPTLKKLQDTVTE